MLFTFYLFISRLKDENVKKTLQEVQKQHRENIDKLASYIQSIGGKPDENLGMKGNMGEMMLNMDLGSSSDMEEIVKKLLKEKLKESIWLKKF